MPGLVLVADDAENLRVDRIEEQARSARMDCLRDVSFGPVTKQQEGAEQLLLGFDIVRQCSGHFPAAFSARRFANSPIDFQLEVLSPPDVFFSAITGPSY